MAKLRLFLSSLLFFLPVLYFAVTMATAAGRRFPGLRWGRKNSCRKYEGRIFFDTLSTYEVRLVLNDIAPRVQGRVSKQRVEGIQTTTTTTHRMSHFHRRRLRRRRELLCLAQGEEEEDDLSRLSSSSSSETTTLHTHEVDWLLVLLSLFPSQKHGSVAGRMYYVRCRTAEGGMRRLLEASTRVFTTS